MRALHRFAAVAVAVATASILIAAAPAQAAGPPPAGGTDFYGNGVVDQSGLIRFVALSSGSRTVVALADVNGGRISRSMFLPGYYTIPVVANDGSTSGLSGDDRTLILMRPSVGGRVRSSTFAVVDARRLLPRHVEVVKLKGDFSFDAISPDGSTMFLIEYLSRRDRTQYLVRAYDVESGQLLPDPIVDPEEEAGEMYGLPLTRAESPDGRWHFTLYDGAHHPFVHALDTVGMTAVCIDLDELPKGTRRHLWRAQLEVSPSGDDLSLVGRPGGSGGTSTLAEIDTTSWTPEYADEIEAEEASASPPAEGSTLVPTEGSLFSPWLLLLAAIFPGALIARRATKAGSSEEPGR